MGHLILVLCVSSNLRLCLHFFEYFAFKVLVIFCYVHFVMFFQRRLTSVSFVLMVNLLNCLSWKFCLRWQLKFQFSSFRLSCVVWNLSCASMVQRSCRNLSRYYMQNLDLFLSLSFSLWLSLGFPSSLSCGYILDFFTI